MTEMTPAVANARRHTIGDLLRRSAQQLGDKLAVRCGSVVTPSTQPVYVVTSISL